MRRRPFTVDQANALLPSLEQLFARIDELRTDIGQRHDQLQILELLWGDHLHEPSNPDVDEAATLRHDMEEGVLEIQRLIRERVLAAGLRFPVGGLEHGLVDFPTTWEGRWVLLCWKRGEPELHAWHELHTGFAGRQVLTEEQVRTMGREEPLDEREGEGGVGL